MAETRFIVGTQRARDKTVQSIIPARIIARVLEGSPRIRDET